jgi:hypothetical protein
VANNTLMIGTTPTPDAASCRALTPPPARLGRHGQRRADSTTSEVVYHCDTGVTAELLDLLDLLGRGGTARVPFHLRRCPRHTPSSAAFIADALASSVNALSRPAVKNR